MHVDSAGAAEEVVAPHLLQQLRTGEHPARVLRQVLQEFEFLICEVQRPAAKPRGVGAFVDHEFAQADLADVLLVGHSAAAAYQQPQPRIDLGRPGAREQNIVEAPLDVDGHEAALVDDGHHRHRGTGRAEQTTQPAGSGQIRARIDDRHIRGAGFQK